MSPSTATTTTSCPCYACFQQRLGLSQRHCHSPCLLQTHCNRTRADGDPILKEACSGRKSQSATCVQRFDDSRNSAIRITYRISLRSSSSREPRYPLLRVVFRLIDWFSCRVEQTDRQCARSHTHNGVCGVDKEKSEAHSLTTTHSFTERTRNWD